MTGTSTAWLGVNNEAKELFGSGSSGGNIMVPTWLITTTQTWTVPVTGNYRLICIGKGGDGGKGGYATLSTSNSWRLFGFPSSGGGGGAVAVADRMLSANDTLSLNISDSQTDINSTALIATAGTNGTDAEALAQKSYPSNKTYTAPSGGTASGSWMTYGYNGNAGESLVGSVGYASTTLPTYRGGDVGCCIYAPAINNNAGIGAFVSPVTNGEVFSIYGNTSDIAYGGYSGAGGAGGMTLLVQSSNASTLSGSFSGGAGGTGAVLIQFLGE